MSGHGGNDSLRGDAGADWLIGGDGHDTLLGGAGNDTLQGEAGNDLIRGDSGNDEIHGEAGRDTMDGGGQDCFRFGTGSGRDTIQDYQRGEAIQIDAALWDGSVADFVAAHVFVNRGGILTIRFTEVDRVQLLGSQALVPEDFLDTISFI